jgi:chemotaxis protein MotA
MADNPAAPQAAAAKPGAPPGAAAATAKDAKAKAKKGGGSKPDLASLAGLVVAMGGIVGGLILEGGEIKDISQVTAAIIVLGGTLGAVMVTTPMGVLISAGKKIGSVFFEQTHNPGAIIEELITYATKARKDGIVSLEKDANQIADPFLRKALNLAVDGTDLQQIRKIMEVEIGLLEHHGEAEAKVYEAAGGYAPTIGIIGAVMGLIQVMKNLADIEAVGHGIAVAFVATVYGVGVSNLFFLPAANKIKSRVAAAVQAREMMLEGIISIVEGQNPKLIRTNLEAYVHAHGPEKKKKDPKAAKADAAKAGAKPADAKAGAKPADAAKPAAAGG